MEQYGAAKLWTDTAFSQVPTALSGAVTQYPDLFHLSPFDDPDKGDAREVATFLRAWADALDPPTTDRT